MRTVLKNRVSPAAPFFYSQAIYFLSMKLLNFATKSILIIGFSVGIYDHLTSILFHGLFSARPEVHLLFNIFWDSLLISDSVAIFLLIFHYRAGVKLGLFIVFTDVTVNASVAILDYLNDRNFVMFGLLTQIPFLCFICYALYNNFTTLKMSEKAH